MRRRTEKNSHAEEPTKRVPPELAGETHLFNPVDREELTLDVGGEDEPPREDIGVSFCS